MNNKGKVVLVGAEDEDNLAIRYLGAVLKKNHHPVKIVSFSNQADINKTLNEVISFQPDMVGISMAFQALALLFLDFIQKLKQIQPNLHVTVGGHFPTFEYSKLLELDIIDSVIRFEGEKSICMLIESLVHGKDLKNIPNLVYKDPVTNCIIENDLITEFPDLNQLPFPLRNKTPQMRLGENFATLLSSRGCFHSNCIYCCIGAFHNQKTKKYEIRTPLNVALEMEELYHKYQVRLFQFHDDNFLLPSSESNLNRLNNLKSYLLEKDVDLNEIGVLIKLRPENLNKDIIDVLKDLGVIGVFLGVENASNSGLNALGRGSTIEDINYSLALLADYDISTTFNLLMFHPKATLDEINENIVFMGKNLDNAYDFGRVEIVAGSPLESLVRRKNLIKGHWPHWNYRIEDDAVEKMFRINSQTFYNENSLYSELSHKMIALSYRAQLIKHLYPGNNSRRILKKNSKILKDFNEFNLQILMKIYYLTIQENWQEGLSDINLTLQKKYLDVLKKTNTLSNEMLKLQLLEKQFQKQGLYNYLQNSSFLKRIFRI